MDGLRNLFAGFGEFNRVNPWGMTVMLLGAASVLSAGALKKRFPAQRAELYVGVTKLIALAVFALGALIAIVC